MQFKIYYGAIDERVSRLIPVQSVFGLHNTGWEFFSESLQESAIDASHWLDLNVNHSQP